MLAKLSTRRYQHGLEPVGSGVAQTATGTSRSAVSRRFVAAAEHALAELLAADLAGLELVAPLVDGIRVADHTCVVASGSPWMAPRSRSPWPRAQARTPPWSVTC
jgi:putative transposase